MEKALLNKKIQKAYKRTQELAERDAQERLEDEYQAEQTQRSDEQELENAQRI